MPPRPPLNVQVWTQFKTFIVGIPRFSRGIDFSSDKVTTFLVVSENYTQIENFISNLEFNNIDNTVKPLSQGAQLKNSN